MEHQDIMSESFHLMINMGGSRKRVKAKHSKWWPLKPPIIRPLVRQVYNGKKLVLEARDLGTCLGMADNLLCLSFSNSKVKSAVRLNNFGRPFQSNTLWVVKSLLSQVLWFLTFIGSQAHFKFSRMSWTISPEKAHCHGILHTISEASWSFWIEGCWVRSCFLEEIKELICRRQTWSNNASCPASIHLNIFPQYLTQKWNFCRTNTVCLFLNNCFRSWLFRNEAVRKKNRRKNNSNRLRLQHAKYSLQICPKWLYAKTERPPSWVHLKLWLVSPMLSGPIGADRFLAIYCSARAPTWYQGH